MSGNVDPDPPRLLLRPLVESDTDRLLEFWNLPEVTRWLLRAASTAEGLRGWIRACTENPDDHSQAVLFDGVLVGVASDHPAIISTLDLRGTGPTS